MEGFQIALTAAADLHKMGKEFFNESGKKPEGEASFLFKQAIKIDAGQAFNKEHGGLELTNAAGIKALERREQIDARVKKAHGEGNEEDKPLQAKVVKIINDL